MGDDDDQIDPLDEMIKKTGCMDFHVQLQLCAAEHQDWRKCQKEVKEFKLCMEEYYKNRKLPPSSQQSDLSEH